MKLYTFILTFCFFSFLSAQSRDEQFPLFRSDIAAAYQGIHLTGLSGHASLIYDGIAGINIGYGYDFLNSYTGSLIFYVNPGPNQFFLFAGYGIFQKREEKVYSIRIRTVHGGAGYESLISDRIVVGQTVSVVKYLDEKFSIPDLRTKQSFELNESNYVEIGIHLGYRFSLDGLFGR
ncbi:MAG: hypothetical protein ACOYNS_05025 [Bacteroidota bacterium]